MDNDIIMSKLQLPNLGKGIIERKRLLSKVSDFKERKITYVVAPAGYGKTVFVRQFIENSKMPFVWYQMDSFDNEPTQFFQYFIRGLTNAISGFKVNIPEFNEANIKSDKQTYNIMTKIIAELETKVTSGLIIAFDDLHLINDGEILKFIQLFFSYLPPSVHVIISGRYQPEINLLRLKASEKIYEINQEDLKFSEQETRALFGQGNQLRSSLQDEETLQRSLLLLNGWALGLHLFKISLAEAVESKAEAAALKARNEIFYYISRELFGGLPEDVQKFLIFTAVLDNMTPESCDYLLGSEDAAVKLKYLERKNLFITVIGSGEEISYRYHHMFRDFLLEQLSVNKGKAYHLAGKYYLHKSSYEQAVEYFRLAHDDQLLIKCVEQAGSELLKQGKLKTVGGWISLITEKGLLESPNLIMLKGELLSYSGNFAEAERWIGQAYHLFKEKGDRDGMVRTTIHKGRILRYRVSFAESTKFFEEFIHDVGVSLPIDLRLEIIVEKIYSQWLMGDIKGAVATAENEAHQGAALVKTKAAERLFSYMTVLYFLQGRYSAALELYRQILESCQGNEDRLEQGSIPLYMAIIHRERGDIHQALEIMKSSVSRKQRVGFTEDLHLVYFNIAVTFLGSRDLPQIENYCRLALETFYQTGGQLTYYELLLKSFHQTIVSYFDEEESEETESIIREALNSLRKGSAYLFAYISPYFLIYYLKYGQVLKADALLNEVIPISEAIGIKFQSAMFYAFKAVILEKMDNQEEMRSFTKKSLKLAAAEGYRRFFLIFPELHPCLRIAIVSGLEEEFVDDLIIRLDKGAVPLLLELLRDEDAKVRNKTVKFLKTIHPSSIEHEIELLFFDRESLVRQEGALLFNELAREDGQVRTKLFIRCLGSFRVYLSADWLNPVSWRTAKAKELFAYLLHRRGQSVSSERILADLWPDLHIEKARNLFHANLTYLKSFLGKCGLKENLQKSSNGYVLDTKGMICDVWLPDIDIRAGVYLEDIYSDWPEDKRVELSYEI